MSTIEGRGVQSVEVGARILHAMVEIGAAAMLRDIAARADIASAQAHAYLVSFRKSGLVEQDPQSGRYLLGPFALQLGLSRMRQVDPLRMASLAATELASDTGMMVTVAVWGTHGPTIIQVQEGITPVHVNLRAGVVYTVTGTATGLLFATYLPDRIVSPVIEAEIRMGSQNLGIGQPNSLGELSEKKREIRRRGCSVTEGLPITGINAIAVPIFDHTRQLQCAITLVGPAPALDVDEGSQSARVMTAFASGLSAKLGFLESKPDTTPHRAEKGSNGEARPQADRTRARRVAV